MIKYLKKILLPQSAGEQHTEPQDVFKPSINEERKLQIATCALFVEMAKADSDFSDEERGKIIKIMKQTFHLEDEYVNELLEMSEERVKESISIYEFTSIINNYFSGDEKFDLLKNLWRLIYVDDNLDKYEDFLIKRIGGTLNVDHKIIIGAKLMVKEELKK